MKSSDVTADILNYLSDGKIHTLQEIADAVECSKSTAQRHVASLSYRYPIEPVFGRDKQGMRLDTKFIISGRIITNEKLQILGKALDLLQKSGCEDINQKLLNELINEFSLPEKSKQEVKVNEI